jgi:hypothetical protein
MFAGPWPNWFQVLQSGTCRLVCIHASTCVCVFASICISIHAAMHSCLCIFVCTHVPASAHEKSVSICSVTLHIYAHAFVCLFVFFLGVCTHAYSLYTHIYVYVYIYVCVCHACVWAHWISLAVAYFLFFFMAVPQWNVPPPTATPVSVPSLCRCHFRERRLKILGSIPSRGRGKDYTEPKVHWRILRL